MPANMSGPGEQDLSGPNNEAILPVSGCVQHHVIYVPTSKGVQVIQRCANQLGSSELPQSQSQVVDVRILSTRGC